MEGSLMLYKANTRLFCQNSSGTIHPKHLASIIKSLRIVSENASHEVCTWDPLNPHKREAPHSCLPRIQPENLQLHYVLTAVPSFVLELFWQSLLPS